MRTVNLGKETGTPLGKGVSDGIMHFSLGPLLRRSPNQPQFVRQVERNLAIPLTKGGDSDPNHFSRRS